jgi:hypothetical protein
MNATLNEKMLKQILTGSVSEVIDPSKQFKAADCKKAADIADKVVETLKELNIYKPE